MTRDEKRKRDVRASFVAVVVIAFLVTSLLAWQIGKTRVLAQRNQTLIVSVHRLQVQQAEFRAIRTKQTTATDYRLCRQIEGLKKVQRDDVKRRLALSLKFVRDHPSGTAGISRAEIDSGIAAIRQTLTNLAASDCHSLPTQKATPLPKP